ncbi:putative membrane protein [Chitinispirillum alkaliphilum]|nr:putative membrane protein [Chitinispirillum alkaliphilum]
MGYQCTKIIVDNDTFNAIPPNLQAKLDYEALKEEFPSPYTVLFIAEFEDADLNEKADSLRSWSQWFTQLKDVASVSGLHNVQVPVRRGFLGISNDYLIPKDHTFSAEELNQRLGDNRNLTEFFISDDQSVLCLIIGLTEDVDRSRLMEQVIEYSDQLDQKDGISTYVTSEGGVSYFIDKSMKRDFSLLLPICFFVIFLLLYRVFRRFRFVAAALSVNIVALIWTFGILSLTGTPFSIVISIIPVILFPIGVADAIHLLRTFTIMNKKGHNVYVSLQKTYEELLIPCLLTSLTTCAGFFSFAFSDISWTRHFGIFTGIAVLFAFLFNTILLPLFLYSDKSRAIYNSHTAEEAALENFWKGFGEFATNSKLRFALLIPLFFFFIVGFLRVNVETNPISMLPENSFLRQSDSFIEEQFGGTRFFSIVLSSEERMDSEEKWNAIEQINQYISSQQGIGNVTSALPLLNRMSMLLSNREISNPAISLITGSGSLLSENFRNYLNQWISEDKTKVRLNATFQSNPELKPLTITSNIEEYVVNEFPQFDILISGPTILNESMASVLIKTQIASLIFTFIPVFLCLMIFFRSVRAGLFSILPIILSTAFVYALMGVMGVNINLVTVITMNTCIGIGIDYSIHFLSGFLHLKNDFQTKEALMKSLKRKGTPIAFNTMIVGLGFLVLSFSTFPPVRDFGILVFASMFISALFSILFITILVSVFGVKNNTHFKSGGTT